MGVVKSKEKKEDEEVLITLRSVLTYVDNLTWKGIVCVRVCVYYSMCLCVCISYGRANKWDVNPRHSNCYLYNMRFESIELNPIIRVVCVAVFVNSNPNTVSKFTDRQQTLQCHYCQIASRCVQNFILIISMAGFSQLSRLSMVV